jgi:uncharacterized coiled-coil DUF342 family protein
VFSAIGKYFRAIGYLLTFRINKARETLDMNPGVMSASYDSIIVEKRKRLNQYKDAISAMIAQEESKKEKLRTLTADIQRLEKLKAGAASKAKQIVAKYNGDITAVKSDPDYVKCQSAFKDFSSTLAEKKSRANEIEEDLEGMVENVSSHKSQIQSLMRELDKLKEEKHDAVADILSSKEEQQIADMMTGLSNDKTSEELRDLRDLRSKASANARVSRELAGMDTARNESEFLEYAEGSLADNEFDALIGLAGETETKEQSAPETRIPEA